MAKRVLGFSIVLVFIALVSNGCYYDNEETLYPSGACDTVDVKYSQQITKIISNQCYDCHSNSTAPISGSGVSWEGYANLSTYLSGGLGVNTSVYLGAINHLPGYPTMPKDRPKLSECDIRTIEIWIENGYPNN